MTNVPYNEAFYEFHDQGAHTSAQVVVPLVQELVSPASVVDVGCGTGTWLAEFKAAGIDDYLGIDGDYVERRLLAIEADRFLPHDLTQPIALERRFDLATCLEVAEHIPAENAGTLIDSLVRLAPIVLFSAAIPFQQGQGHVNEQWPEYWHDHFTARDYVVVDALRDAIWLNDQVEPWYRQNLLFFVERSRLGDYSRLRELFKAAGEAPYLPRVHPEHVKAMFANARKHILKARASAVRATLNLREINLLAFPDWTLPPAALLEQLRTLLTAVIAHPQRERVSIVISTGRDEGSLGTQLVGRACQEVLMPGGAPQAAAPGVNAVGGPKINANDWEVLLSCVQGRIILPGEATEAIAAVGAESLPTVSLAAIQQQQPLAG